MTPVELRTRPMVARHARSVVAIAIGAAVAVAGLVGWMAVVRGPEFVDHVTLDNRTQYDVDIDVTDGQGGGLLALATAQPYRPTRVEDVIDQGNVWVFVLTRAGDDIARIRLTRDDLESSNWRVVLPETLEDTLTAMGQVPLKF